LNSKGFQIETLSETPSKSSGNDELVDLLDDAHVLNEYALSCIYGAMQDGLKAGYRGEWRFQTFREHIEHAIIHLQQLIYQADQEEDHLAHALCRLAMAAVQEGVEEDENLLGIDRWESEGGSSNGAEAVGEISGPKLDQTGQVVGHPSGLQPRASSSLPCELPWYCDLCKIYHPGNIVR
jgi:hypothetical protein